jgi:hypothetical protein
LGIQKVENKYVHPFNLIHHSKSQLLHFMVLLRALDFLSHIKKKVLPLTSEKMIHG